MKRTLLFAALLLLAACKKDEVAAAPPAASPKVEQPLAAPPPKPATEYALAIAAAPPYVAGKEAVATITIEAKEGFHVNPDYPVSFKPSAAEGVKYAGERVQLGEPAKKTPCKAKEEDNCAVDLNLALTPEKAGVATVDGVLSFSVCSEEKCLTPKQQLTLAIDVSDAPTP